MFLVFQRLSGKSMDVSERGGCGAHLGIGERADSPLSKLSSALIYSLDKRFCNWDSCSYGLDVTNSDMRPWVRVSGFSDVFGPG